MKGGGLARLITIENEVLPAMITEAVNTTGAGSVVARSILTGVVAAGNICCLLRTLQGVTNPLLLYLAARWQLRRRRAARVSRPG